MQLPRLHLNSVLGHEVELANGLAQFSNEISSTVTYPYELNVRVDSNMISKLVNRVPMQNETD